MSTGGVVGTQGAIRFSRTRGRLGGSQDQGLQYPSPFFDIAHTYLPATVKQMFRWCRYYFLVNPLINAVVFKMAEYPITDVIFDTDRLDLKESWRTLLMEHLRYRSFQIEVGLDYYTYGNALVSVFYPFIKLLKCTECGYEISAAEANYNFRNFQFNWYCPKCDHHGPAKVRDHYIRALKGIRLIRWNPEDVDIHYNDITGEYTYYYQIPGQLKNDIIIGKKAVVETIPQLFIDALRKKKAVVFNRDNIYHFKRPTLAGKDRGWGPPLILPVLKDTFYLQILRKAQECVSLTSEVETLSGLVHADDVRVGDLVRTHTGAWKPVEEKWYRDAREDEVGRKITLTSMRGYPTTYSPLHPVFTIRRNDASRRKDTKEVQRSSNILERPHLYEEVLCPAGQLGVGEYVLYPRHLPIKEEVHVDVQTKTGMRSTDGFVYSGCSEKTAEAFEALECGEKVQHDNAGRVAKRAVRDGRTPKRMPRTIPMTDDLAYILGWYAGDGSCNARSVFFSLGKEDNAAPLIEAIRREFGITATVEEGESVNTVVLSDVIVRHLIKGLIPGTARQKKAPEEILNAPNSMKLSYLRGLWESDGSSDENRVVVTSSSRAQAYDVYRMLIHCGCIASIGDLKPSVSVIEGREVRSKGSYNVTVCHASADRLRSLWECGDGPEVVSGKSGFFWGSYFATRICAVEEVEEDQYIDFKVADDTTFCTPGTATKNSIALEHIVPLRVLFPQAGSATSDPFCTINLQDWREQVASEVQRWRCVAPGSLVETKDGLRLAGDVGVGDWLKNRNGDFEQVVKRHERDIEPGETAYRLKVRGQSAIDTIFSEEHPIWAARKVNNGNGHKLGLPDFIRVDELNVGDYVGYPIARKIRHTPYIDLAQHVDRAATENWVYVDHTCTDVPEAFEYLLGGGEDLPRGEVLQKYGWGLNAYKTAQDAVHQGRTLRRVPRFLPVDKQLMYALGLYAAEGNATPKGVFFSLNKNEWPIVDQLDCFFAEKFCASRTGGEKSENGVQYAYCSVIAAQLFHSLIPDTAVNKKLPELVMTAPDELVVEAIRGVLDGDGSYYDDKTVLGVASRQLAEDVRQIILSWQIMPGISFTSGKDVVICGKETRGSGCYHVQVSGDQHVRLMAKLTGEVYEGPDHCRIGLFRDGFAWFRINGIEEAETETVVAFQMEGDSTFCTWGVATHNSDNNYIPILPLPIGHQTIGGDGRALLLSQEIRVWSEHIVAGMGVPVELIFGGLSYSGSNVSLRMLENTFLGYLQDHLSMVRWVIRNVASYLSISPVKVRFKPFKMADDLQRKAYLFQLNQAGKISDESICADADHDSQKEDLIMEREAARRAATMKKQRLMQSEIEGEAQMVTMKWQNKVQRQQMMEQAAIQNEMMKDQMSFQGQQQNQMMQDQMAIQQGQAPQPPNPEQQPTPRNPKLISAMPGNVQSPLTLQRVNALPPNATGEQLAGRQNVDLLLLARQMADRIQALGPTKTPRALSILRQKQPELYDVVLGLMAGGSNGPSRAATAAAKPLPEQKPPQRGHEAALI